MIRIKQALYKQFATEQKLIKTSSETEGLFKLNNKHNPK